MKDFFCGPESFTPDLSPVVGESAELRNYFLAAGMNSIGILSGPGVGRVRLSIIGLFICQCLRLLCEVHCWLQMRLHCIVAFT